MSFDRDNSYEGLSSKHMDYKHILTKFYKENDPGMITEVESFLLKYKGKEAKFFLILAKKYRKPNPLNMVFESLLKEIDCKDYKALVELYLATFYPSCAGEAETLLTKYKGQEDELFKNLSSNFHACNPLKRPKPINYKQLLRNFYEDNDPEKVAEVDATLEKCKGKEAILFSVLAKKYEKPNVLNSVFHSRMKDIDGNDYLSLLKLYLSVFNPACVGSSACLLARYHGREDELFSKLSSKFYANNPFEGRKPTSPVATSLRSTCIGPIRRSPRPVPQSPRITT